MQYLKSSMLFAVIAAFFLSFAACGGDDNSDTDQYVNDSDVTDEEVPDDDLPPMCEPLHQDINDAITLVGPAAVTTTEYVCDGSDGAVYYVMSIPQDSIVELELTWQNEYDDMDLYVYYGDSQGTLYWQDFSANEQSGTQETREYSRTLSDAGYIFAHVEPYAISDQSNGAPFTLSINVLPACMVDGDCSAGEYCQMTYYTIGYDYYGSMYRDISINGRCDTYEAPTGDAFGPEDGNNVSNDSYSYATAVDYSTVAGQDMKVASWDLDVIKYEMTTAGQLQVELLWDDLVSDYGLDFLVMTLDDNDEFAGGWLATSTDANSEYLELDYMTPGTYYILVGQFMLYQLFDIGAAEGTYTLNINVDTSKLCETDEDCSSTRATCVQNDYADYDAVVEQVGACIDYVPTAATGAPLGNYCDGDDDCESGYCMDLDAKYHSDNLCSTTCDEAASTDECLAIGTDYHCSAWSGYCVANCTHLDECPTNTICDFQNGGTNGVCQLQFCTTDDTCLAINGAAADLYCAFDVKVSTSGAFTMSTSRMCKIREPDVSTDCTIDTDDEASADDNDYWEYAEFVDLTSYDGYSFNSDVEMINAYDCADDKDWYQVIIPNDGSSYIYDLSLQVHGKDNGIYYLAAFDWTTGEQVYGYDMDFDDATTDFIINMQINNLDAGTDVFVMVSSVGWALSKGTSSYVASKVDSTYGTGYTLKAVATMKNDYDGCEEDNDCYTDDYSRSLCQQNGSCAFADFKDYASDYGDLCMNDLDCDIFTKYGDISCSLTVGYSDSQVCTYSCSNDDDCNSDFGFDGSSWTCTSNNQCQRIDCQADADCPYDVWQYTACNTSASTCVECTQDSNCVTWASYGLTVCDPTLYSCGMCIDNDGCADNASGPNCVEYEDSTGIYKICSCSVDADCASSLGGKVCKAGSSFGTCGCMTDADCQTGSGMVCQSDWLTGEPTNCGVPSGF